VRDETCGLLRAYAKEDLSARRQELVAQLKRFRKIRLTAFAHPGDGRGRRDL
jgi:hypothetical protein